MHSLYPYTQITDPEPTTKACALPYRTDIGLLCSQATLHWCLGEENASTGRGAGRIELTYALFRHRRVYHRWYAFEAPTQHIRNEFVDLLLFIPFPEWLKRLPKSEYQVHVAGVAFLCPSIVQMKLLQRSVPLLKLSPASTFWITRSILGIVQESYTSHKSEAIDSILGCARLQLWKSERNSVSSLRGKLFEVYMLHIWLFE